MLKLRKVELQKLTEVKKECIEGENNDFRKVELSLEKFGKVKKSLVNLRQVDWQKNWVNLKFNKVKKS